MNIKISADSTCDLSKELIEEFAIHIIPLYVIKGGETFHDGVDIHPADIYDFVNHGGALCSTQAVNVADYADFFEKASKEYDAVIHINLGSHFSSCYQNACIAASDFDNVYVVDSCNLSTGHGHVVLAAAEMAKAGMDAQTIVEKCTDLAKRVDASFILNRLDYMVKGGRCSGVAAFGANLLKLKPCIEVVNGKMVVAKKYRGNFDKCVEQYVAERMKDRDDLESHRIFVTTSCHDFNYSEIAARTIEKYQHFDIVNYTNAGCTIGSHCGDNCIGILYVGKNEKK